MITAKKSITGVYSSKPVYFSDLDLDFNLNPTTGDLVPLKNDLSIRRSVRNLVMLNFGEKQFQPKIGSNVRKILFEPLTPDVAGRLQSYIQQTLTNFEPRIQLQSVEVIPIYSEDGYNVTVSFFLLNTVSQLQTISLFLTRIR
jgi:hypothetical protein